MKPRTDRSQPTGSSNIPLALPIICLIPDYIIGQKPGRSDQAATAPANYWDVTIWGIGLRVFFLAIGNRTVSSRTILCPCHARR